jgi:alkylhydroperoxidase family enzyme
MAHLDPLPEDATPELEAEFETFEEILGFVPNSLLTMQRKPEIVEGFDYLTQKVMQEADDVDPGFKRLAAHMASHAAGCQYCEAHSLIAADIHGVSQEKLEDHWTEDEIVELLAAISLYGFLNRWNDTMATDLEEVPREMGERVLADQEWDGGKHVSGE